MQPRHATPAAVLAWVVALAAGCGDSLETRVLAFAEPTAALASTDADLVALVRKIKSQRNLSSQLDGPTGPDSQNAAAALSQAYSDALHLRLAPQVEPLIDPRTDLDARADFLRRHELLVAKTAKALDLPRTRFEIGHRYGFFARMRYLDDAALAARLMAASAMRYAAINGVTESLADTMRSLRVTHELSRVRRVEARVLAATLRAESLRASAAIFDAGIFERFEAEQLYGLLRDHLADWPEAERMLVGERATVVHAYEAIRGGMLDKLITAEERARLAETGQLKKLKSASAEAIDADEARYLRAMRSLLAVSEDPYHERLPAIEETIAEVNQEPRLFAAVLFLRDLPETLRTAAEDRARVEGWALALAATADLRLPPFRTSPLSGGDYRVDRGVDALRVQFGPTEDDVVALPLVVR